MPIKCNCEHNEMVVLYKCYADRTDWKCKGCDKLISVILDPNKICKCHKCKNLACNFQSWDGGKYCYSCFTGIERAANGIKEQNNVNILMYGNKDGFDREEYWERKPLL